MRTNGKEYKVHSELVNIQYALNKWWLSLLLSTGFGQGKCPTRGRLGLRFEG